MTNESVAVWTRVNSPFALVNAQWNETTATAKSNETENENDNPSGP